MPLLFSIAHRPGFDVFHDRTLTLIKSATGDHFVTKRQRPAAPPQRRDFAKRLLSALVIRPEHR